MHPRDHLLMAIKSNYPEAVANFINKVDPKEEIEKKNTPIQLASELGHWDCVEVIAKHKRAGASDEARYGSALYIAVYENRITTAKILLEAEASKNWASPLTGDKCLHIAVRNRNVPMIALLLSFDMDLTLENTAQQTPIQLAYHLGHWDCVQAIAKTKKTDAADAARYGNALLGAVLKNHIDIVRILLEAGASKTWRLLPPTGDQCLHLAVRNRNVAMISLLLSFDFDLTLKNTEKQTPIQLAYHLGHWDCVEAIAKNKKTDAADAARYTDALLNAINQNQVDTTKILLEAGLSKICSSSSNGYRYLHIAIQNRNVAMITLLLSFDFDLTKENAAQQTPIQLAHRLGYWDCVEAIAKNKKTDVSDTARYGSALLIAVHENRIDTAKILLKAGASKTWKWPLTGDQCLHTAVRNGNAPMIALLLSFGFDIKVKNTEEQTAIQLAESLKVNTLNEGWKIYYDLQSLKLILPVLIQSIRQPKSAFYKIPLDCSALIVSFLNQKEPALQKTIISDYNLHVKISTNCFLNANPNNKSRRHSPEYKILMTELNTALQSSHTTENIGRAVDTYVEKTHGKKTRSRLLLYKYHLIRDLPKIKDEKNKIITCSGRRHPK